MVCLSESIIFFLCCSIFIALWASPYPLDSFEQTEETEANEKCSLSSPDTVFMFRYLECFISGMIIQKHSSLHGYLQSAPQPFRLGNLLKIQCNFFSFLSLVSLISFCFLCRLHNSEHGDIRSILSNGQVFTYSGLLVNGTFSKRYTHIYFSLLATILP